MNLIILSFGLSIASAQDLPTLVQKVEAKYSSVESIQADFQQNTRSTLMNNDIEVSGSVILKRKRKMRWEFSSPDNRLFLSDGVQTSMWDPSSKQYFIFDASNNGATQILDNLSSLNDYFEITIVEKESTDKFQLSLTPKQTTQLSSSIKTLDVTLEEKELILSELTILDHMGSKTTIVFDNVTMNPTVLDTVFQFSPPEGAEIIKSNGI